MQKINWNENYSTRYHEDGSKWLHQNGLEYDMKGNALDKSAVRAKVAEAANEAQESANAALAVAQKLQDEADSAQALLNEPDSPQTVAALKEALDNLSISYPASAKKSDLEQLWVDAQDV